MLTGVSISAAFAADADFAELELSGFAARAVERLRAEADRGEAEAHAALALLVRLAGAETSA